MATWTSDSLELWNDLVTEFGVTATYKGTSFPCIKNPVRSGFRMTVNAYDKQADTVIDMLRTTSQTLGLYGISGRPTGQNIRPILTVGANQYEVLTMENDDDTQPSIRLNCAQLQ
jgi:hypothetical protein